MKDDESTLEGATGHSAPAGLSLRQYRPLAVSRATSAAAASDEAAAVRHRVAVVLVILGACVIGLGGLIIRSMDAATAWQILFYRGLALSTAMTMALLFRFRGRLGAELRGAGKWAALGGVLQGLATTSFILSLAHTTVANTLFILSAAPFVTALLAWAVLGETVRQSTWIAMAVSLAGIALMVGNGLVTGTVLGNLTALVATIGFSCFVVALRRGRARNMLPAIVIGGAVASIMGLVGSQFDVSVSLHDVILSVIWGGLIQCTAHFLFVLGSRHVAGAELTLLLLVEVVTGPIWVWIAFGEVPATLTLIGGLVVMSAVAGRAFVGMIPRARTKETI